MVGKTVHGRPDQRSFGMDHRVLRATQYHMPVEYGTANPRKTRGQSLSGGVRMKISVLRAFT